MNMWLKTSRLLSYKMHTHCVFVLLTGSFRCPFFIWWTGIFFLTGSCTCILRANYGWWCNSCHPPWCTCWCSCLRIWCHSDQPCSHGQDVTECFSPFICLFCFPLQHVQYFHCLISGPMEIERIDAFKHRFFSWESVWFCILFLIYLMWLGDYLLLACLL